MSRAGNEDLEWTRKSKGHTQDHGKEQMLMGSTRKGKSCYDEDKEREGGGHDIFEDLKMDTERFMDKNIIKKGKMRGHRGT